MLVGEHGKDTEFVGCVLALCLDPEEGPFVFADADHGQHWSRTMATDDNGQGLTWSRMMQAADKAGLGQSQPFMMQWLQIILAKMQLANNIGHEVCQP